VLQRRLQTAAALYMTVSFLFGGLAGVLLAGYLLLCTQHSWLAALYLTWLYWVDLDACDRGGRRIHWVRQWRIWRYLAGYFPARLVKTAELDPRCNYILGSHPHGVLCAGAFINFATEGTGFSALFPGIVPHFLTLRFNFWLPFFRDLIMSYGACAVSRENLLWILTQQGTGNAAVVIIGGAQEALDARPGTCLLTLEKRKGFVRLALQCGAHLVPVFSFGENDIFDQVHNPPGSGLRMIQELVKRWIGVAPVLFHGHGLLPFRAQIVTVVGKPIHVERMEDPTLKQIDELHSKYKEALAKLFHENKHKYGAENLQLRIN
ncbi:unnamed protein product, partial [Ixodes persulcatus]